MTALIVSDTHGYEGNLAKVLEKVGHIDMLIHLGDFESGAERIKKMVDCPVEMVAGNNDFSSSELKEKLIRVGKYNIFLTHGHKQKVFYGDEMIYHAAISVGADIVMYGHTHKPSIRYINNIQFINPGSISQPRQDGGKPSYIIMEIDREGEVHFTINYFLNNNVFF